MKATRSLYSGPILDVCWLLLSHALALNYGVQANKFSFFKNCAPKYQPMPPMSRIGTFTLSFNNFNCSNFFYLCYLNLKEKDPIRRKTN